MSLLDIDKDNVSVQKEKDGLREVFKIKIKRSSSPKPTKKTLTVKLMEPIIA